MPDYAAAFANGGLDPVNHFYPAKIGEVLDIVLQNYAGPSVSGIGLSTLST
jgi:L-ascorbate oxidase